MTILKLLCFLFILATGYSATAQTATEMALFKESDISLVTPTGTIQGTLTVQLPLQKSPGPVALLISGSGPTDRNGNNPMMQNNALQMLAQELAATGIATVRYDKRAIGKSIIPNFSEVNYRFDDLVKDAVGWIDLLKKDSRFTKISIIGHSEGALIGLEAALATKPNAYISIAGAARSADSLILAQVAQQPEVVRNEVRDILVQLKAGKEVSSFSPYLAPLFRSSVQPYMISWLRYTPQDDLKKLKIKTLIIQGTSDLQVPVTEAQQLAKAKPDAKLLLIPDMNHVLKQVSPSKEENLATYNNPTLPLAKELIPAIVDFLK